MIYYNTVYCKNSLSSELACRLYQFLQRRNLFFWVDTYQLTLHEKKYLFIVIQQIFHQTFSKCVSRAVLHHQYARLHFVLCLLRIHKFESFRFYGFFHRFCSASLYQKPSHVTCVAKFTKQWFSRQLLQLSVDLNIWKLHQTI